MGGIGRRDIANTPLRVSFLNDLAALITEHERQLVAVARTFLANSNALRTFGPHFVTLFPGNELVNWMTGKGASIRRDLNKLHTLIRRMRQFWHPCEALPQYTMMHKEQAQTTVHRLEDVVGADRGRVPWPFDGSCWRSGECGEGALLAKTKE